MTIVFANSRLFNLLFNIVRCSRNEYTALLKINKELFQGGGFMLQGLRTNLPTSSLYFTPYSLHLSYIIVDLRNSIFSFLIVPGILPATYSLIRSPIVLVK